MVMKLLPWNCPSATGLGLWTMEHAVGVEPSPQSTLQL
jgi:hypothetical protein